MLQWTEHRRTAIACCGLGTLLLIVTLRSAAASARIAAGALDYADDFSDAASGWPREWERETASENIRGGYTVDRSLPEEAYYAVLHDAWNRAFVSGPYAVRGDFDLEVRARYSYVQSWYRGNRYGILLSKEQIDPEDPHSVHGYAFQVEILPTDQGQNFDTAWWQFKEWYRTDWQGDDGGDEDRTIAGDASAAIHSALGEWNTLRVERRGTSFFLYINGVYLRAVSVSDNTEPLYIGLFGRHTGSGTTELSYDVVYEWDDVQVRAYPEPTAQVYLPMVSTRWSSGYAPPCDASNQHCEHHDSHQAAYGPLAPGQPYSAYPEDDDDYYFFVLGQRRSVRVELQNYVPTSSSGTVLLYGPAVDGELGPQIDYYGVRGDTLMSLGPHALEAGRYYVRVYTDSDHSSRDLYTLRMWAD